MKKLILIHYEKTILKSKDFDEWWRNVCWDWRRYMTFRKSCQNFYLESRMKNLVRTPWAIFIEDKKWKYALIRVETKWWVLECRMQIPYSFIRKIKNVK